MSFIFPRKSIARDSGEKAKINLPPSPPPLSPASWRTSPAPPHPEGARVVVAVSGGRRFDLPPAPAARSARAARRHARGCAFQPPAARPAGGPATPPPSSRRRSPPACAFTSASGTPSRSGSAARDPCRSSRAARDRIPARAGAPPARDRGARAHRRRPGRDSPDAFSGGGRTRGARRHPALQPWRTARAPAAVRASRRHRELALRAVRALAHRPDHATRRYRRNRVRLDLLPVVARDYNPASSSGWARSRKCCGATTTSSKHTRRTSSNAPRPGPPVCFHPRGARSGPPAALSRALLAAMRAVARWPADFRAVISRRSWLPARRPDPGTCREASRAAATAAACSSPRDRHAHAGDQPAHPPAGARPGGTSRRQRGEGEDRARSQDFDRGPSAPTRSGWLSTWTACIRPGGTVTPAGRSLPAPRAGRGQETQELFIEAKIPAGGRSGCRWSATGTASSGPRTAAGAPLPVHPATRRLLVLEHEPASEPSDHGHSA